MREPTIAGLALAIGLAGGLLMFNKTDNFKHRHGCKSCEYESKNMMYERCRLCKQRKGSKWTKKPEPKPAYCECCGVEKQ